MKQHKILFFVPRHINAKDIHRELITHLQACLSAEAYVNLVTRRMLSGFLTMILSTSSGAGATVLTGSPPGLMSIMSHICLHR